MNLFLLLSVPLASFSVYRWRHQAYPILDDGRSWILGFVWSMISLVGASFFGRAREFSGDLLAAFFGLTLTDAILVPGLVIVAWVLTRPRANSLELALWMTMVFTLAGFRDFVSTRPSFDLNELFLVPFDRIFLILAVPVMVAKALEATAKPAQWYWFVAAGALTLSGSLFQVLSFAWCGWFVGIFLGLGITLALLVQQGAAPNGNGPLSFLQTIGAGRTKRP